METASKIKADDPVQILFVDDEKGVLQSLRRLFIDENYEVLLANSGEEALEILKYHFNVGVIVSDQRMPGMTGVDFLKRAKQIAPDSLRILLTGYADINAVVDAINKGGAYRYITKPWKDDDLIQTVREAEKYYSLSRRNRELQTVVEKQNAELKHWNSELEYMVQEQTLELQKNNKILEDLNVSLKRNFKNTIIVFSSLLELRDKKMINHSKNIAEISVKIARAMKLPGIDQEAITVSSLLHDIGKIGIPDIMLLKEFEEMDDREKKEYMLHPVRGQAAIDSVPTLRKAGILIRHHHEWFNGEGFPDSLAGEGIPLGSRVIAAADYFERTIRKMETDNDAAVALSHVKESIGSRIDPQIYPYLESAVHEMYAKMRANAGMAEKELSVNDIREGMLISRDVKSGTGVNLLARGTVLDTINIEAIRRYYELDPSTGGIFVVEEQE